MTIREKEEKLYDASLDILLEAMLKRNDKIIGKQAFTAAQTAFNGWHKNNQTQNGKMTNLMILAKLNNVNNVSELLTLNGIEITIPDGKLLDSKKRKN